MNPTISNARTLNLDHVILFPSTTLDRWWASAIFFCFFALSSRDGKLGVGHGQKPFYMPVSLPPLMGIWALGVGCNAIFFCLYARFSRREIGRWAWAVMPFSFAFLPVSQDRKLGAGRGLTPFVFISCLVCTIEGGEKRNPNV